MAEPLLRIPRKAAAHYWDIDAYLKDGNHLNALIMSTNRLS